MTSRQIRSAGTNLRIREASIADAEELLRVIQLAYAEFWGKVDPPSSSERETRERLEHTLTASRALLAERDAQSLGCIFYVYEPDHIYLYRLAVVPTARRHGLGRLLVSQVEDIAALQGAYRVRLAVRLALPQNQAFYARLGYRQISLERHEGYAEPTYMVMEKVVGQDAGAISQT